MTAEASPAISRWNPVAAVAAWAVPGLGHVILGQRRRGAILGASIGLLWIIGLLIGGIGVIDREDHPAWFLGQMLVGPSLAVDVYHQQLPPPLPGNNPPYTPSLARVNEQGVLYTALAGLLNLLAVLDVLYRDPADPRYRPEGAPPPPEGGAA